MPKPRIKLDINNGWSQGIYAIFGGDHIDDNREGNCCDEVYDSKNVIAEIQAWKGNGGSEYWCIDCLKLLEEYLGIGEKIIVGKDHLKNVASKDYYRWFRTDIPPGKLWPLVEKAKGELMAFS